VLYPDGGVWVARFLSERNECSAAIAHKPLVDFVPLRRCLSPVEAILNIVPHATAIKYQRNSKGQEYGHSESSKNERRVTLLARLIRLKIVSLKTQSTY